MNRLFGAFLWAVFLFFAIFLYAKEERRRLAEQEGLSLLLTHICSELCSFLRPLDEIYASFENRALASCGFLSVLRKEGFAAALSSGCLHLEEQVWRPLLPFASTLGSHLYAEEKEATAAAKAAAITAYEERKREAPRKIKLHATLFLCGGMLLLLLLI